jgi:predicted nucleotidyltransferase component of viral defense system
MREICEVEDQDGIVFDARSVEGTKIKEDDEYDGVRIKINAHLAGARIPMQVDIGFGDAVYPEPELATFPVLLPMAAPQIRAYPRESAIAEKLHAMVELDIRNSRMKDFYDIWYMAQTWTFEMSLLHRAITVAFERRGLSIPEGAPFALTADFLNDSQKKQQWNAFISRFNSAGVAPSLDEVGALLRTFLLPCLYANSPTGTQARRWVPGSGWTDAAG